MTEEPMENGSIIPARPNTKEAVAMKMSQNWVKMDERNHFFLTVRWTDTIYPVGKTMPLIIKGKNEGTVKIEFTFRITLLNLLNSEGFTKYDASCTPKEYYEMLKGWYGKKPDWNEYASTVQVVGVERI